MKKSDQIKKSIDDALIQAEALQNIASKEERELTADEQSTWDGLMAKETGQVAVLEGEFKKAQVFEEEQRRVRATRDLITAQSPTFDTTGTGPATPAIPSSVRVLPQKLKAFRGNGDLGQAQRDAYDCGLWFMSLMLRGSRPEAAQSAREKLIARRGAEWYATQSESVPADGGYLVPPQFEAAVIVYREQVGVARKLARVVPMISDTWTGIKQSSGTTVYYPGEEGAITPSSLALGRYTLTAKKRAILSYVSSELNADNIVPIMDLLATDMGHQFGLKEDQEFVAGDGTSTYGGVQGVKPAVTAATASVATASSASTWATLTLADFFSCLSLLGDKYRGLPLAWLCSGPFKWQTMDRLALAQGGAVAMDVINGQPQPMFLGYPVMISDRMPTTTAVSTIGALFGAFGNAVVLGDRAGIGVAVSEHYLFNTDQIAVRATARYDINVHEEGTTAAAGAIVGLSTHS